jgi:DNA mismatch repair protein MutL
MSEDGTIRELDQQTVERIAAGEVVERPASVVKELVENGLDADANNVAVTVDAGGKGRIRITDDGIGMTESEVRRAVEEHTTSKIRDIDDLESGVATLGFRGEALHAIGAVSRLTVTTRPRSDRDVDAAHGTELVVEGGEVTSITPAGCPEGTTIAVGDLFYNVPARRKYLKQDGTEFAHVNDVVTSYALANPNVATSLEHGGRETFATTGQGDLQSAVMAVYGRDVAKAMIEVGGGDSDDGDLPEGPLDGVSGLVSHPETNRASTEYVTTYVNGRYVRSATVRDAIVDAYGGQLAPDRYPFAVCFLDLPGDAVDVNVHPRKMEVRFADPEGVREQVRAAVKEALLRSSAPRGRSAVAETAVEPERRDEPSADGHETGEKGGSRGSDGAEDEATAPPTRERDSIGPGDVRETPGDTDPTDQTETAGSERSRPSASDSSASAETVGGAETDSHATDSAGGVSERDPESTDPHDGRRFRPGTEQARLSKNETPDGSDDEREPYDRLPAMRVLGQLDDTYVIAETAEGFVLIDQHAADERVNYERLRERFAGETTVQALAEPVELSVTAREAALFEEYTDALARLGFRAERVDDRTVAVRTIPELIAEAAGPDFVRDVLSAFVTGEAAATETVEAAADDLLADLACYPSVTGNTSLTEGSVMDLFDRLDDCENPWACPHGRPVVIEIDREEIEARFERDYPGHE